MAQHEKREVPEVVHNQAQEQFELRVGDAVCVLKYRRLPGKFVVYHTEVPQPIEGQGLAARMTHAALAYARSEKLQVEPRCPYTAAFMKRNREYADLLAAS